MIASGLKNMIYKNMKYTLYSSKLIILREETQHIELFKYVNGQYLPDEKQCFEKIAIKLAVKNIYRLFSL